MAALASDWYVTRPLGNGIDLITEPHVHPFVSANTYLVRGRDRDLLVDTGMGIVPLRPILQRTLGLTPGKPVIALATHIHLDHVGALHEFEERAGPRMSQQAFVTMPDAVTYAEMFRVLDAPVSALPHPGWDAAHYRIAPAPLTMPVGEGDTIDLGDRSFSVLHLPGHAPDQIALLDEADGLFFSGDAIYDDQLIDDLPDSNRSDYRRTMQRILALPVRSGHGGHGPGFDAARMREIAEAYLRTTNA